MVLYIYGRSLQSVGDTSRDRHDRWLVDNGDDLAKEIGDIEQVTSLSCSISAASCGGVVVMAETEGVATSMILSAI